MIDESFWKGKKVFLTGHSGFKGSWLCIWLHSLGATVTGYSLNPPTDPSLFKLCKIDKLAKSVIADIGDRDALNSAMLSAAPEIVIHMAAQPLVKESYRNPVYTYAVNVLGTAHLFEAVRNCETVRAVVNVTSDKCYENKEWVWGYRENEPLGGYDPYSSSKACAELVTSAYRNSFFNVRDYHIHGIGLATARAGNVIGGGDWAADRLVPDCMRAFLKGDRVVINNPGSIRPWQHVLDSLHGYLLLTERLYKEGPRFSESWNFGPSDLDAKPVEWLVKRLCENWGEGAAYEIDRGEHPHEAYYLKLDCSKAITVLGWRPVWRLEKALDTTIEWTKAYKSGAGMMDKCLQQIEQYYRDASAV